MSGGGGLGFGCSMEMDRRSFLGTAVAAVAGAGVVGARGTEERKKLMLGYDNFAFRAMGWKAAEFID